MNEETKTLMDGLLDEMNRCRELLKEYESIGAPGDVRSSNDKA
jgi:hypothetical protein